MRYFKKHIFRKFRKNPPRKSIPSNRFLIKNGLKPWKLFKSRSCHKRNFQDFQSNYPFKQMWKSSTEKKRTYTQVVDLIAIFSQVVKKGEPAVQRCAVE